MSALALTIVVAIVEFFIGAFISKLALIVGVPVLLAIGLVTFLVLRKKNPQAAKNVVDKVMSRGRDYRPVLIGLSMVCALSLALCGYTFWKGQSNVEKLDEAKIELNELQSELSRISRINYELSQAAREVTDRQGLRINSLADDLNECRAGKEAEIQERIEAIETDAQRRMESNRQKLERLDELEKLFELDQCQMHAVRMCGPVNDRLRDYLSGP